MTESRVTKLLGIAIQKYGKSISMCNGRTTWLDCITSHGAEDVLWFNTPDNSTHSVMLQKDKGERLWQNID